MLYSRRERSPYRLIGERCLVGAPGERTVAIGGSGLVVWVMLDEPRTADGLVDIVRDELPEFPDDLILEALDVLVERGLVEAKP